MDYKNYLKDGDDFAGVMKVMKQRGVYKPRKEGGLEYAAYVKDRVNVLKQNIEVFEQALGTENVQVMKKQLKQIEASIRLIKKKVK